MPPTFSQPNPRPPATGYWALLRSARDFRLLFLARTTSLLGDWFNVIGVLALLRESAGSDPRVIGALFIVKLLPTFLAGPLAGVVADRFSRKRIMIVTDLLRFGFVVSLFSARAHPELAGPIVLVLTALQMGAAAFAEPARTASVPNLVAPEELARANALSAVAWSVMFTLGAGLGGIATDLFGWRWALAFDAVTYLVSAALVSRIHLPQRARRRKGPLDLATLSGARDVWEGARYILAHPPVAATMLLKPGWGLAGSITLLLTLFGESVYPIGGRPDLGISILYVARALGTGVGPVLSRRLTGERPQAVRNLLAVAFPWAALNYVLFSIVHHPVWAALFVFSAHLGGSIVWVDSTVLLQRAVPDDFRGRVFAAELGLTTLLMSASTFVYGELASRVALPVLPRLLAVTLLLPGFAWWWVSRRIWSASEPSAPAAPAPSSPH